MCWPWDVTTAGRQSNDCWVQIGSACLVRGRIVLSTLYERVCAPARATDFYAAFSQTLRGMLTNTCALAN